MRYYTVHIPSGLNHGLPAEDDTPHRARQVLGAALFVREGFSWLAFFFSIPWPSLTVYGSPYSLWRQPWL